MKRSLALNARKIKNVKSGKGKWRRAFASQQQAIEKRKELLYNRYVERQEAFCELQVAYTCAELKDSPIILVPYDVKISDTSDDIQDEQLDENVPVTIVAVNEDIREQSAKQLSRFNGQCFVTGELIKLLVERDREELLILNNITSTTSHSNFTAIANEASYHRALSLMPLLAEKVVVSNKHIKQLSPRTLLLWFNKFEKSKYRGFEEDRRGSCKNDSFIGDFNLSVMFKFYMKTTNNLTIKSTKSYLEDTIVQLALVKDLGNYGLTIPLATATVWRWMRQNGAAYSTAKKCYYTDRHDTIENITYRNESYIPLMESLTQRMPVFVSVPLDSANHKALQDIRNIRGLDNNDPIPTFLDKETDIKMVKIHCDWLKDDCYEQFRKKCLHESGFPGEFLYKNQHCFPSLVSVQCRHNHSPSNCKCHQILYHCGQDEAVYRQYAMSSKEWTVDGAGKMRKKNEGKGEMVSAFQDAWRGFGFPTSDEELEKINQFRTDRGKPLMTSTPGIAFLEYGMNKEGYWDYAKFAVQVDDILDWFDTLYPDYQMLLEVDHSSGHTKKKENGLSTENMNLEWGGKQSKLRDSLITASSLGNTMEYTVVTKDNKELVYKRLSAGDVQSMVFKEGDLPPFFSPDQPPFNTLATVQRKRKAGDQGSEAFDEKTIKGYIGEAKGIKQLLIERGLWMKGMRGSQDAKQRAKLLAEGKELIDANLDAPRVLSQCADFLNEKGALQELVESRGHILILSPKCHPELAGCGIEYSWGKSKQYFRRKANDMIAANLHRSIVASIQSDVLPIERIWKFERRSRDYRRMYKDVAKDIADGVINQKDISYAGLELMQKVYKVHRDIGVIERLYLKSPVKV